MPTLTLATIAIYNVQGKLVEGYPCNTGNYSLTLYVAMQAAIFKTANGHQYEAGKGCLLRSITVAQECDASKALL